MELLVSSELRLPRSQRYHGLLDLPPASSLSFAPPLFIQLDHRPNFVLVLSFVTPVFFPPIPVTFSNFPAAKNLFPA